MGNCLATEAWIHRVYFQSSSLCFHYITRSVHLPPNKPIDPSNMLCLDFLYCYPTPMELWSQLKISQIVTKALWSMWFHRTKIYRPWALIPCESWVQYSMSDINKISTTFKTSYIDTDIGVYSTQKSQSPIYSILECDYSCSNPLIYAPALNNV